MISCELLLWTLNSYYPPTIPHPTPSRWASISAESGEALPAHLPLPQPEHQPCLWFSWGFRRRKQCVLAAISQSLSSFLDQVISSSLAPRQSLLHKRLWDNKPIIMPCSVFLKLSILSVLVKRDLPGYKQGRNSFTFLWLFSGCLLNILTNGKPWFSFSFFFFPPKVLSAWLYYVPVE